MLLLCSSSLGSWTLCFLLFLLLLLLLSELSAAALWRFCLAELGLPSPSPAAFRSHWDTSAELGSPATQAVGTQDRPAAAQGCREDAATSWHCSPRAPSDARSEAVPGLCRRHVLPVILN